MLLGVTYDFKALDAAVSRGCKTADNICICFGGECPEQSHCP